MKKIAFSKLNKLFAVFLVVVSLTMAISSAFCSYAAKEFSTQYTDHACLYNIDYDTYLYEEGMDDQIDPCGTTKIMIALLAFEHYQDYSATITVRDEMVSDVIGITNGFSGGQTYTVEEMLAALIISNSNDAAYILAYDIAGDSASLMKMMNERAQELGMDKTVYKNITGLYTSAMKTTVTDIITLMKEATKYAKYIEISSTPTYTIAETDTHPKFILHNRNYFVSTYYNLYYYLSNVTGLSVSNSTNIGDCLALTAKDSSGLSYLVVVMGSNDPAEPEKDVLYAEEDAIDLMTWGFRNHEVFNIVNSGEMICEIPVTLSQDSRAVIALPESKVSALLSSDIDVGESVAFDYELIDDKIMAPVTKNQVVGTLTILIDGEEYTTINLVAKNAVARSNTKYIFYRIGMFFISPFMIVMYVLFILLVIAVIVLRRRNEKLKKNHIYRK